MSPAPGCRNGSTPTVLLVHGAFTDASIWAGVISRLHLAGIDVIAPANPLRGLAIDARYLASAADEIDGPAILVGHSYGGAVITAVAATMSNVVGLVYVAAYALEAGESPLDISRRFPDSLLAPALRPATFLDADGTPAVELYIERDAFPRVFAADLPTPIAAAAAATQRPIAATAFEETSPTAAWKRLPCWYVVASADQVINPDAQRFMANRASAQTIEVDGSHAVAASQPAPVADQISSAALSVRRLPAPPSPSDAHAFIHRKDALG